MSEGDLQIRTTKANQLPDNHSGDYILVVLHRALRFQDNPVIEAASHHAAKLNTGIVVCNELDLNPSYVTPRYCFFALGAFRDLAVALVSQNIPCIQTVKQDSSQLPSLIESAAAIYSDEEFTHWDRARQSELLDMATQGVYLVDASRVVPLKKLPQGLKTTPEFRKAHGKLRDEYQALRQETAANIPQIKNLDFPNRHNYAHYSDRELEETVASLEIDHTIAISQNHPPTQETIKKRINKLKENILSRYKWIRNNPALEYSTSELSPYLHFGMLSPHHLLAEIEASDVPKTYTWKYRDEFLTWREWSHYQAFYMPNLHLYESLPDKAKATLEAHAQDARPELCSFEDILHGNTGDRTFNAAQREWLHTGWLHNNLRMYWAKQILRFTESPQKAWETACYLNDYLSLDGRDPATYASIQWSFGRAKPGYSEKPIYGWVAPKSDRAILNREGMKEWIEERTKH